MTNKEKEILGFMEKLNLSRADAEQLWEDDRDDTPEEKVEGTKRTYTKSGKPRKKVEKERKVDTEKAEIIKMVQDGITGMGGTIVSTKTETETRVELNGEEYTLRLVKHRKPKA